MYDDSAVRLILGRAIEIDADKAGASREEIVRLGIEVGVSEPSVRQALEEYNATPVHDRSGNITPYSGLSGGRLLILTSGLGIASGLLSTGSIASRLMVIPSFTVAVSLLTIGGLMMISGGLALSERRQSVEAYLKRNAAVWLGAAFGWTLSAALLEKYDIVRASAHVVEAGLTTALTCVIVTSITGAGYVAVRSARQGLSSGSDQGGLATPRMLTILKRRVLDRLRLWINSLRTDMGVPGQHRSPEIAGLKNTTKPAF